MTDYDKFVTTDQRTTPRTRNRHIRNWVLLIIVFTIIVIALLAGADPTN